MTGNGASTLRNVGVVLAGGTGTRMGIGVPKQLLKIAGKTIIEHTIEALHAASEIDEILVLMAPGFVNDVQNLVDGGKYPKVSRIIEGGSTRNETTQVALDAIGDDECNVLFHDAVRPLLSSRIIRECINALHKYEAVDVAIPSADTIIAVEDEIIRDIPDRSTLRRGQTPQGFRSSTLRKAYKEASKDPYFSATDDCGVVLRYLPEVPIKVVEGSENNLKVTHPVDVFIADKLFQLTSHVVPRPENPHDYGEHFRGRTVVVFGGGYGIGADIVDLARGFGADVFSFSRSQNGCYVENSDDVQRALDKAHAATGRIDYIAVTAGVLRVGPLTETTDETIEEALRVNYMAPVSIARLAFRYLRDTKGQLLLYTSSSYTRGRANYSLYSSSKSAVVNLTQALADEWADHEVRVNCINPERTATPMRAKAFGEEAPGTLLSPKVVALTSLDVLISGLTGHVIDVRRVDPSGASPARTASDVESIAQMVAEAEAAAAEESEFQAN